MARSLWEAFISSIRRNSEDDEDGTGDDRFVPSPLNLSVQFSHGGPDNEVDRELDRIEQQARELEGDQRGK